MGTVALLLGNGFLVRMVTAGRVGFVATELGEALFEVVPGVPLVAKKNDAHIYSLVLKTLIGLAST